MSSLFFSVSDPGRPRSRSPRRATRPDAYPTVPAYDIPKHMPKHASRPASGRRKPSRNATARPNGNGQPPATGARKRAHRHRPGAARRRRGGRTEARAAAGPQPSQWAGAGGERTYEPSIMDGRSGERTESERKRTALAPASARSRAEPEVRRTTLNSTYDERTN